MNSRTHSNGVVEVLDVDNYLRRGSWDEIPDYITTCETCNRSWDDAVFSALTPTWDGCCPFESEHKAPPEYVGDYPAKFLPINEGKTMNSEQAQDETLFAHRDRVSKEETDELVPIESNKDEEKRYPLGYWDTLSQLNNAIRDMESLEKIKELYVAYVLSAKNGNKVHASKTLQVDRRTLQRWAKRERVVPISIKEISGQLCDGT